MEKTARSGKVRIVENELTPERIQHDREALELIWRRPPGIIGWLSTTNHKDIAIRYIVTALIFFGLGGVLAALMRIQLAVPNNHFLGPDLYNQIFTVHGSTMMFLFAVPIMEGFGLYFVPLMVGTRNVAFPRMNALGYYLYVFGGIFLYVGLLLNIGPDTGWFSYVPLAGPEFSPGKRVDFWAQMITFTEASALIGAVEIITTAFKMRSPAMSLNRIPLFVWSMIVTSFMIIFAMPSIMLGSTMLMMDRMMLVNTHFFNPAEGGDALLYQHVFWFFGHPEVYIIFIPALGFVSTIITPMARRSMFGYLWLVLSLISTGFIAFGLWVHHMFATPVAELGRSFFTAASMIIALPTGVQIYCWIATLWGRKPQVKLPLLFVIGFFATFIIGGLTGVMLASIPIDVQTHDTFFVVAHLHYVLIGGSVFPLFGAIYYWFPKWTGKLLNETLGKTNFWLLFIGFHLTFFPMHILGLKGMPRRIYVYTAESGWGTLNLVVTIGAAILFISVVLFIINVLWARKYGPTVEENPWGASTLEWFASSPPAPYNFQYLPVVGDVDPLWEADGELAIVTGLGFSKREVLTTSVMDGVPDHRYELPGDSLIPFILSIVITATLIGTVFHPYAIVYGAPVIALGFVFWFWFGNKPGQFPEEKYLYPPESTKGEYLRLQEQKS